MSITNSLISFWELEAASGTRVDSTASANDLTDSGVTTSTTGIVGNCPVFATTKLSHVTNASLETGDIDWTIAGWVKFAAWSVDYTVVSKWPFPNAQNEYVVHYDSAAGQLAFLIELGDDSGVLGANSNVSIPNLDTAWHFFVVGFDSVNNQIFISVDNEALITLANTATPGMHVGNGDFELAGTAFGALNFVGNIDQVGFWKRVLTAAERTWLYNAGAGRSYAALLGLVNIGVYDAEIRDTAWFDTSALREGWWDYGMPFEHDLIDIGTPTPPVTAGTWPGWIQSYGGWF